MSSTIGHLLKLSIFGESHSDSIGATIFGLPAGIKIDLETIKKDLNKRNPKDLFSTERKEEDEPIFLCGVFNGVTTGSPITVIFKNKDVNSNCYRKGEVRPSHSDFTYYLKYDGNNDYRGGGFSSGRLTAPLVAIGSICRSILEKKDILISSHILSLGKNKDREFNYENILNDFDTLKNESFPVLDEEIKGRIKQSLLNAKEKKDSLGGIIETAIINTPVGIGEPFFDSLESYFSQLLFSIPGVKSVEFGDIRENIDKYGSELNDQLSYENNKTVFLSNHNGGILGGISNGCPIIIKTALKPTSSIGIAQKSIDLEKQENIELITNGRHDTSIVRRASIVIDSLLAFGLLDMLMISKGRKEI